MKKITKVIAAVVLLSCLMATTVLAKTGTVTGETVRIREKADKSSGVVINLHKGDKVEIISENGEWYEIKTDTHKGYMHKDYVQVEGEEASVETPAEPSAPVETPENTVEENTTEDNNQADSEEITEPEKPQEEVKESLIGKEIILKNDVQTYLLPSIISSKVRVIAKEQKVIVIDEINGWIKISNANSYDWIYTKSMEIDTIQEEQPEETQPEEPTTPETAMNESEVGYINVNRANIRETNSTDAKIVGRLNLNTVVEIEGQEGEWYKIKSGSIEGYVSADLVTKGKPVTSRSTEDDRGTEVPSNLNNSLTQALGSSKVEEVSTPVETPVTSTPVETAPVASNGNNVVEYAKTFLGYKYVSGGKSPSTGFDCSGFTSYVYKHFGVTISASSASQINYGTPVDKANMQPGDLILYQNDAKTKIGHCGIYIGGGKFIHAANSKRGVVIDNVDSSYYGPRFVAARRIVN